MNRPQAAGTNRTGMPRGGMSAGMDQVSSWSRDIRLVSGLILLAFATTHFLNHAVGILGVDAMEKVQAWR